MFNDKSGQMMLINAFLLAIAVVTITLMLNNVIYSSNIAYEGFMDQSRYDELSYKASIVNETAYAYDADTAHYGQYISDYEAYLNKLMIVKGRYVDLSSTYPITWLNIYGKDSKVEYTIKSTTTPTPTVPPTPTPTPPAPVKPYIVTLSINKSTIFTDGNDVVKLVAKVTDQNYIRQENVPLQFSATTMGNIVEPAAGGSPDGTTGPDGTLIAYFLDSQKKDEGDVQITVSIASTFDPTTPTSNIVIITCIPAEPELSGKHVPYTVTLDAKKQVPITITFDFAYDSITKGNVNVFNNESYVNTQLLGSAPSFDSKTNTVNFVVTRLKETDPGEVTLWCEVTGKDSDGVSYYKIEKIIIYIQPMSGGHIPYTVSGNTVMDASNNVNVVVTFDFTGFSSCNLNLNTVYTDTSTNTNPSFTDNKNPLVLTASANKVSFTVKKTADPADVTFWVEVTGIDSAMDSNPNNKATDKHLYYDMFEQIVVPILPTPPIADFSSNVTVGNSPLTVQFNGISTGGTATSWVWDFGDSSGTSTEKNPIHTFPANNGQFAVTYSVTLTATNIVGSDTETKVSYITVKPPAPVASFEGTPTSGNKPLAVQFTDKSSGSYLTYIWNFGDGTAVNNLKNPQHTYNNKGTYAVTLTVTNAGGTSTSTITKYIDVKN